MSFVIKFSLFPFPIFKQTIDVMRTAELAHGPYITNNVIPFEFLASGNLLALGVIGNLVLLAFLGVYIPLTSKKFDSMKALTLITFVVSLFFELTQLGVSMATGFMYRMFKVDDLILNSLGACIVYALFRLGTHWYHKVKLHSVGVFFFSPTEC